MTKLYFLCSETRVAVSDSEGQISILSIDSDQGIDCMFKWTAHEYSAWIAAFNYWNTNIVYSGKFAIFMYLCIHCKRFACKNCSLTYLVAGGDDCLMKGWDIRTDPSVPVFCNRK